MEPIVEAFGMALIAAMATDTWRQVCDAVGSMWRRVRPKSQADGVVRDLEKLRGQVLAAQRDGIDVQPALAAIWQARLQELLRDNSTLAADMQRILNEMLIPVLAPSERARIDKIIMTGTSHDNSTFNQVLGNQIIIKP
jgi:hypothetical protein